jgi:hypothetical protein
MVTPRLRIASLCSLLIANPLAWGQQLDSVFPVGIQAGTSHDIAFTGSGLENPSAVHCTQASVTFDVVRKGEDDHITVHATADTPPGLYDVQVFGARGLSSTRAFYVTTRPHIVETDPNSLEATVQSVPMPCAISGRIAKGDVDAYRFQAAKGDRVVIECWSDRIDSSLRAVLELHAADGKRLAVNRGYFGVDPVIAFAIPEDGEYVARLYDLVYAGGDSHFYRLDIGDGPRVVFAMPPVIERGSKTEVTMYGWNLSTDPKKPPALPDPHFGKPLDLESTTVRVTAPKSHSFPPVRRRPSELAMDAFAYRYPGADVPITIGLTDLPAAVERDQNSHDAHAIEIPGEVVGQLTRSGERDMFAIDVRRGEVIYLEAFGERIGSPVDLDIAVLDAKGQIELATFHDEVPNIGGLRFPSNHLDPEGRWVAPADGRYLVMVRDLISGIRSDPRRVYRLSVRREEPDVQLVAIAQPESPAGINLQRGGRAVVDVLAFRRRGLQTSVRVSARKLPTGVTCPDIWLGPGVASAPLVLSAAEDVEESITTLDLVGHIDGQKGAITRTVQSGTMIRSGDSTGCGRLQAELPMAIAGEAPLQISARGHETRDHHLYGELQVRHSPGGVLDVAVRVLRREAGHTAPVKLTAVGLPDVIRNQSATIPAGESTGYISFYLPHSLQAGTYTLAIRADTEASIRGQEKPQTVTVHSNAVVFKVHPPAFRLDLDVSAPTKIKRGQIVEVNYTARRINGFISKIHTELAAPGRVTDVGRLRGRGVTSVGQTDSGTIQIIANDDAELGLIPFLRLYAVGVLEDEAVFHGSCFLGLEIIE